jgi:phosphate uptake regulator
MAMEYRKLIGQKNGLTITIPIDWIRSHGLKKGDYVIVEEADGGLTISSK